MKLNKLLIIIPSFFLLFSCQNNTSSSNSNSSSSSSLPSNSSNSYTQVGEQKEKLKDPELAESTLTYAIPNSELTLTRGEPYTTVEEVAAYVMAFDSLPVNYALQDSAYEAVCAKTYTSQCRIYKYPYHNDNSGKYDSPYLTDGATDYFEADMESPTGAYSMTGRGVYRIVFSFQEDHEILYYTDDHYDHYTEYLNYYGGWGSWFGDKSSSKHNFTAAWVTSVEVDNIDFSAFIK